MSGYDITSKFSLVDNVTPILGNVVTSLSSVMDNMEMINANSKNLIDTSSLRAGRTAIEELKSSMSLIDDGTNQNVAAQEMHNKALADGSSAADNLWGKIKGIAFTYMGVQGVKKVFDMSDELSNTTARLNVLTGDLKETKRVQDEIYQSAMRSRSEYSMTGDIVSKLGLQAGHAFGNNQEIIAFTEQLQKRFKIAGTDAQGIESVMYNLTQAMSAGVLRGQDLNAVLANAPSIAQDTAKYLGYSVEEVKSLAEEGELTAQVVKEAMLAYSTEINDKFSTIPYTFSDLWVMAGSTMTKALEPALSKLSQLANSDKFQKGISNVLSTVEMLGTMFVNVIGIAVSGAAIIGDNWELIAPIIFGVVGALAAYNIIQGISNGIALASAVSSAVRGVALEGEALAARNATLAQYGLNAALLASPITWIVVGILAFIGVVYAAVGAYNKFTNSTVSGTGVIVGAMAAGLAFVGNLFVGFLNGALGIAEGIANAFISLAEFLANVFSNPLEAAMGLFISFGQGVLSILKPVASIIDSITGWDVGGAIGNLDSAMTSWKKDNFSKEYKHLDRWEADKVERFNYGDAYNAGYGVGENAANSFKSFFSADNLFDQSFGEDILKSMSEGGSAPASLGDIAKGTDATAKNTEVMAKELSRTTDDLSALREILTARAITNVTSKEVKVEQTNNFGDINNIDDLDGFTNHLVETISEEFQVGIGGVV